MLANAAELIRDFAKVCALAGMTVSEAEIRHEVIKPPHSRLALPPNVSAVYVFSLASKPEIVLKVGKAGRRVPLVLCLSTCAPQKLCVAHRTVHSSLLEQATLIRGLES